MEQGERNPLPKLYSQDDIAHIALLLGSDSYLYHLAVSQKPEFITELKAFLTSPRFMEALHTSYEQKQSVSRPMVVRSEDDDGNDLVDEPNILVNPDLIRHGLATEGALIHLMSLYKRVTGEDIELYGVS